MTPGDGCDEAADVRVGAGIGEAADVRVEALDVLVVGAGPVGLATLLALRRAGVRAVGVDRGAGPSSYPKARVLSTRSMELLRRWGVADAVAAAALPEDWTERITVGRTLAGRELLRIESPAGLGADSPEHRVLCTQDRLERILADAVEAVGPGAVRWGTTALTVTGREGWSEVPLRGPDGARSLARARYVVLADGSRGLGAGGTLPGGGVRHRVMRQVSFRIDARLRPLVGERRSFVTYLLGGPHPVHLLVVDGDRDWIVTMVAARADTAADYPPQRVTALLARALGLPAGDPVVATAVVRETRFWDLSYRVADTFVVDRSIRAGDAAHELPPTGAAGLNLGLADVDGLVWRLTAILDGWGSSAGLLADYDRERRAIADRTGRWARGCFNAVGLAATAAAREDPAGLAEAARLLAVYLDHPGLDLGPLLPPHAQDPALLVADGRPGSRAPHRRLDPDDGHRAGPGPDPGPRARPGGVSTLDHFDRCPVLLLGDHAHATAAAAERISAEHAIPLRLLRLPGAPDAALVRPDGYVWWRGEAAGLEEALLSLVGHRTARRAGEDRAHAIP